MSEYERLKRVENLTRICTIITEKIKENITTDPNIKEIRIPCDDGIEVVIGSELIEYLMKNEVDITYYAGRCKPGVEIRFK